jgi:hypothetical protein
MERVCILPAADLQAQSQLNLKPHQTPTKIYFPPNQQPPTKPVPKPTGNSSTDAPSHV